MGSIQYTNDIDVHIALITAPSYAKEKAEKYYTRAKTNHQIMFTTWVTSANFFKGLPTDLQQIRSLARQARAEQAGAHPPAAARQLFRRLRDAFEKPAI